MKKLLLICYSIIITLFITSFVSPVYTAPNKNNVTIVLGEEVYTSQSSTNVTIVLGDIITDTNCNPSLNVDWIITDTQVCNKVEVTTGTGNIIVKSTGLLFLTGGANVTTTELMIEGTGDRVFVNHGCEIWS